MQCKHYRNEQTPEPKWISSLTSKKIFYVFYNFTVNRSKKLYLNSVGKSFTATCHRNVCRLMMISYSTNWLFYTYTRVHESVFRRTEARTRNTLVKHCYKYHLKIVCSLRWTKQDLLDKCTRVSALAFDVNNTTVA